jgi:hypothetical protein
MLKPLVMNLKKTYFVSRVNPIIGCKDRKSINAWVFGLGLFLIVLAITLFDLNADKLKPLSLTIKVSVAVLFAFGTYLLVMAINIFNAEGEVDDPYCGKIEISSSYNALVGNAFTALVSLWRAIFIVIMIPPLILPWMVGGYLLYFPYYKDKMYIYIIYFCVAAGIFCIKELRPVFWTITINNFRGMAEFFAEVMLLTVFMLSGLKIPVISWYWAEKMAERYSPLRR